MLAVRLQEAEQTAESVQARVGSPEKTKQRLQTEAEDLTQPGKGKKASHSRASSTSLMSKIWCWSLSVNSLIPYFLVF